MPTTANMPFHSLQHLSPAAVLGLWHLTEPPTALWAALAPHEAHEAYRALLPAGADATRQAQWLAGRALIHTLLESFVPQPARLRVHNDATGRPWLAGGAGGLEVSLSHSGAWAAAVLSRGGRIGVDVEIIRDKAQRLAARFLADEEWARARVATQAAPAETASAHYTLLWSAKETLYKLAGQRGIAFKKQLLLGAFAPQEAGEIPATLVLGEAQTRHCICYSQPAPGYVLTHCHEPAA